MKGEIRQREVSLFRAISQATYTRGSLRARSFPEVITRLFRGIQRQVLLELVETEQTITNRF